MEERQNKSGIPYLAVLVALFYVNDFLFMPVRGYQMWLFVDYMVRIAALVVIIYLIRARTATARDFGLMPMALKQGVFWSILLSITGVLIDQAGADLLARVSPIMKQAAYPSITNPYIKTFDLTVGVALVSITEELIFRAYFYSVLKGVIKKTGVLIAVSCVVFGFSHWSLGWNIIITATVWSILPMYVMVRTGSVVPALIAHYVTDFAAFF